jgi:hypothetical protein
MISTVRIINKTTQGQSVTRSSLAALPESGDAYIATTLQDLMLHIYIRRSPNFML